MEKNSRVDLKMKNHIDSTLIAATPNFFVVRPPIVNSVIYSSLAFKWNLSYIRHQEKCLGLMEGVLKGFLIDYPQPKEHRPVVYHLQMAEDDNCGVDFSKIGFDGFNKTTHVELLQEKLQANASNFKEPKLSPLTKTYISTSLDGVVQIRAKYRALLRFLGTHETLDRAKEDPVYTLPGQPKDKRRKSQVMSLAESRLVAMRDHQFKQRRKRQIFALAAALGITAFVSGTYISQIGLRSSINALNANQEHIAAQLQDVTHTLNEVTTSIRDWSTQVAKLGHLYEGTAGKVLELEFSMQALALRMDLTQDGGRVTALIDALTDQKNSHELMTRYLDEEILDDALVRLRSAASMHGLRIDPDIRMVQQLFQFPIHGVYDLKKETYMIIVSIPLFGDHDRYEVHEFVPTPQKIIRPADNNGQGKTEWYSMLNPPNRYLAIGQDNNRLEFSKEELDSCKMLLGLRYCSFPTLYFGTHESCLYSYFSDKKQLDSCKVDLAKEFIFAKQTSKDHWLFVDTTADSVRVKCLDNNGSAVQEMKNGKLMLTLYPGCTAQSERIKVEASFDAFDIDVNVPDPVIPTLEHLEQMEQILNRVGVEDVESIVKQLDHMKDKFSNPEFATIDLDSLKLQSIHADRSDTNLFIVAGVIVGLIVLIAIFQCLHKRYHGSYYCFSRPCSNSTSPNDTFDRTTELTQVSYIDREVNPEGPVRMSEIVKAQKRFDDEVAARVGYLPVRRMKKMSHLSRLNSLPVRQIVVTPPTDVDSAEEATERDPLKRGLESPPPKYDVEVERNLQACVNTYRNLNRDLDQIANRHSLRRRSSLHLPKNFRPFAPSPPRHPFPRNSNQVSYYRDTQDGPRLTYRDTTGLEVQGMALASEQLKSKLESKFPGVDFGPGNTFNRLAFSQFLTSDETTRKRYNADLRRAVNGLQHEDEDCEPRGSQTSLNANAKPFYPSAPTPVN